MHALGADGLSKLWELTKALIESNSSSGMFAMEVDEDGSLYCIYEDEDATPTFELDDDCNLYYVIEE